MRVFVLLASWRIKREFSLFTRPEAKQAVLCERFLMLPLSLTAINGNVMIKWKSAVADVGRYVILMK